jgi:glycine/D-amino acid oxidase-like deaminating enzyme/nitrite reductase/ring-hydroxylating ferredoxin subunit
VSEESVPVWFDGVGESRLRALRSDASCEVLVIGAGIVGASTAWELARAGVDVMIVDGGRVAGGTTGASTAKVSALQRTVYSTIADHSGIDVASSYAGVQSLAVEHLVTTVERLGVDCDLHRRPSWVFARDGAEVKLVEREREVALECGLAVVEDDPHLPFPVDAAIRLDDQLTVNPVAYCDALVADVVALGGRAHTDTRIVELAGPDPHRALTATGHTISAKHVVVATHFPGFHQGLLFARLRVHREHVLAAPLPEGVDAPDLYVSAGEDLRSLRVAPSAEGDMLLVTGAPFMPGSDDARARRAELGDWASQHIPGWRPTRAWAAQDAASPDGLPYIGELRPITHPGEGIWGATGFGGWGLTNGVVSGLLLRDLILGSDPHDWRSLFSTARAHPVPEARRVAKQGAGFVRAFAGRRLRAALPPGADAAVADLGLGESTLVHLEGRPVAVHRDPEGELHAVEATCPHMGCLVGFDRTEGTWACPCHGSRFALDGTVLEGPATTDLAAYPMTGVDDAPAGYRPDDPY